jgi:hypothetical protein
MLGVWIAAHDFHITANADSRGIAGVILGWCAVNLLQLRIVNLGSKGILYRVKVCLVAVRSDLYSALNATSTISHEFLSPRQAATSYEITQAKFGVSVQACPCPGIAPSLSFLFGRHVLGLGSDEAPNLIALESANADIPYLLIMELFARSPEVHEKLGHGVDGNVRETAARAKTIAFHQHSKDGGSISNREAIHVL